MIAKKFIWQLRHNIFSPVAKDYINQIKTAGQTLLTIINDILDFSKIESGAIDIHETKYSPMTLVSNIVNAITTRIGTKDVEFIVDIVPEWQPERAAHA